MNDLPGDLLLYYEIIREMINSWFWWSKANLISMTSLNLAIIEFDIKRKISGNDNVDASDGQSPT